jgi:hypothetical protein
MSARRRATLTTALAFAQLPPHAQALRDALRMQAQMRRRAWWN